MFSYNAFLLKQKAQENGIETGGKLPSLSDTAPSNASNDSDNDVNTNNGANDIEIVSVSRPGYQPAISKHTLQQRRDLARSLSTNAPIPHGIALPGRMTAPRVSRPAGTTMTSQQQRTEYHIDDDDDDYDHQSIIMTNNTHNYKYNDIVQQEYSSHDVPHSSILSSQSHQAVNFNQSFSPVVVNLDDSDDEILIVQGNRNGATRENMNNNTNLYRDRINSNTRHDNRRDKRKGQKKYQRNGIHSSNTTTTSSSSMSSFSHQNTSYNIDDTYDLYQDNIQHDYISIGKSSNIPSSLHSGSEIPPFQPISRWGTPLASFAPAVDSRQSSLKMGPDPTNIIVIRGLSSTSHLIPDSTHDDFTPPPPPPSKRKPKQSKLKILLPRHPPLYYYTLTNLPMVPPRLHRNPRLSNSTFQDNSLFHLPSLPDPLRYPPYTSLATLLHFEYYSPFYISPNSFFDGKLINNIAFPYLFYILHMGLTFTKFEWTNLIKFMGDTTSSLYTQKAPKSRYLPLQHTPSRQSAPQRDNANPTTVINNETAVVQTPIQVSQSNTNISASVSSSTINYDIHSPHEVQLYSNIQYYKRSRYDLPALRLSSRLLPLHCFLYQHRLQYSTYDRIMYTIKPRLGEPCPHIQNGIKHKKMIVKHIIQTSKYPIIHPSNIDITSLDDIKKSIYTEQSTIISNDTINNSLSLHDISDEIIPLWYYNSIYTSGINQSELYYSFIASIHPYIRIELLNYYNDKYNTLYNDSIYIDNIYNDLKQYNQYIDDNNIIDYAYEMSNRTTRHYQYQHHSSSFSSHRHDSYHSSSRHHRPSTRPTQRDLPRSDIRSDNSYPNNTNYNNRQYPFNAYDKSSSSSSISTSLLPSKHASLSSLPSSTYHDDEKYHDDNDNKTNKTIQFCNKLLPQLPSLKHKPDLSISIIVLPSKTRPTSPSHLLKQSFRLFRDIGQLVLHVPIFQQRWLHPYAIIKKYIALLSQTTPRVTSQNRKMRLNDSSIDTLYSPQPVPINTNNHAIRVDTNDVSKRTRGASKRTRQNTQRFYRNDDYESSDDNDDHDDNIYGRNTTYYSNNTSDNDDNTSLINEPSDDSDIEPLFPSNMYPSNMNDIVMNTTRQKDNIAPMALTLSDINYYFTVYNEYITLCVLSYQTANAFSYYERCLRFSNPILSGGGDRALFPTYEDINEINDWCSKAYLDSLLPHPVSLDDDDIDVDNTDHRDMYDNSNSNLKKPLNPATFFKYRPLNATLATNIMDIWRGHDPSIEFTDLKWLKDLEESGLHKKTQEKMNANLSRIKHCPYTEIQETDSNGHIVTVLALDDDDDDDDNNNNTNGDNHDNDNNDDDIIINKSQIPTFSSNNSRIAVKVEPNTRNNNNNTTHSLIDEYTKNYAESLIRRDNIYDDISKRSVVSLLPFLCLDPFRPEAVSRDIMGIDYVLNPLYKLDDCGTFLLTTAHTLSMKSDDIFQYSPFVLTVNYPRTLHQIQQYTSNLFLDAIYDSVSPSQSIIQRQKEFNIISSNLGNGNMSVNEDDYDTNNTHSDIEEIVCIDDDNNNNNNKPCHSRLKRDINNLNALMVENAYRAAKGCDPKYSFNQSSSSSEAAAVAGLSSVISPSYLINQPSEILPALTPSPPDQAYIWCNIHRMLCAITPDDEYHQFRKCPLTHLTYDLRAIMVASNMINQSTYIPPITYTPSMVSVLSLLPNSMISKTDNSIPSSSPSSPRMKPPLPLESIYLHTTVGANFDTRLYDFQTILLIIRDHYIHCMDKQYKFMFPNRYLFTQKYIIPWITRFRRNFSDDFGYGDNYIKLIHPNNKFRSFYSDFFQVRLCSSVDKTHIIGGEYGVFSTCDINPDDFIDFMIPECHINPHPSLGTSISREYHIPTDPDNPATMPEFHTPSQTNIKHSRLLLWEYSGVLTSFPSDGHFSFGIPDDDITACLGSIKQSIDNTKQNIPNPFSNGRTFEQLQEIRSKTGEYIDTLSPVMPLPHPNEISILRSQSFYHDNLINSSSPSSAGCTPSSSPSHITSPQSILSNLIPEDIPDLHDLDTLLMDSNTLSSISQCPQRSSKNKKNAHINTLFGDEPTLDINAAYYGNESRYINSYIGIADEPNVEFITYYKPVRVLIPLSDPYTTLHVPSILSSSSATTASATPLSFSPPPPPLTSQSTNNSNNNNMNNISAPPGFKYVTKYQMSVGVMLTKPIKKGQELLIDYGEKYPLPSNPAVDIE